MLRDKTYKLYILQKNFKEKGFLLTLAKKIIPYLLRPISDFLKRYQFFFKIWYGFIPNLKQRLLPFQSNSLMLFLPKTELMEKVRKFWYSNTPGNFILDGESISRKDIFTYGGPNPEFSCPICQKSEWLSRVRQENLFAPHNCPQAKACKELCEKQGSEFWTHFHQNFDFSLGCDDSLPAPKGIYVLFGKKEMFYAQRLEPMERVFHRQFAFASQFDLAEAPWGIDWGKYDFAFMYLPGAMSKFERPPIPVILFAHDIWREPKATQWVLEWLKPDVLLTTYPTQWEEYYRIPKSAKVIFHPMFASNFFTRSNFSQKSIDLLSIGNLRGPLYEERRKLTEQLKNFQKQYPSYKIKFSHIVGTIEPAPEKGLEYTDSQGNTIRYLNKWSEYLGSAKYAVFGKMKYPILVGKYYETLGSGAVSIFPQVPDLKLLGVKPFEHYIPLSEVEGNNARLKYFLDNYNDFKYIAENAVKWYKKNSDKMLFNSFENLIREATNYKFPKRLL